MLNFAYDLNSSLTLLIYVIAVTVIVFAMLGISYVLGERHTGRSTNEPYESGILITGTAQIKFNAKFYLIGMFFVIFDLEAVFLFAWASAVPELGWVAYFQVLFFILVLVFGLIYLWRTGGLDIGPPLRVPRIDGEKIKVGAPPSRVAAASTTAGASTPKA